MIVLGVDPGCGHTGWAVVEMPKRKLLCSQTIRFDAADTISVLVAACENWKPELVGVQNPIGDGRVPRFHKGDRSGIGLARNVELSAMILGTLQGKGFNAVAVAPMRGTGCKMKLREWQWFWGWYGRTSQDARDAAQIALQAYKETQG